MFKKMNKHYVSPIDLFMLQYDRAHKPSPSQQAEIDKYKRIYQLRDNPRTEKEKMSGIWEEF